MAGVISGSKQCKVGPTQPTRPTRPTPPAPGKSTCGQQSTFHTSHRIVGGQPAKPGEWPWQIGLWRRSSSGGVSGRHPFCGGILIRSNVVLTAAHCIRQPPSFYAVNVGDYDVTTKGPQEEAVKVSRIYRHEGYKPRVTRKMQNDIALLVLQKHVPLKAQVNIACMPTKKDIEGECFATGWGRLKERGRQPNVLQEVKLPIVPMEDCKRAYGNKITDGMICAGEKNGGKDSCQGDSGGPLVCRKSINSETWELRGITSFGHGCARAGKYGVYTEAYHYNAWIQDKILRNDVDEAMDELQGLQDALQSIP